MKQDQNHGACLMIAAVLLTTAVLLVWMWAINYTGGCLTC